MAASDAMSNQLPTTKLAADGTTPMVSKLNKKELKICLDERGLDYNAEASNAALKEILLGSRSSQEAQGL